MSMIGNFLRVSPTELRTYLRNSTLLQERIDASYRGDPDLIDIDKSWDGLMFLLTGSGIADEPTDPLAKIFVSEKVVDEDQDLGYGPATYVNPDEVVTLSKALAAIDRDELAERYDPDAMNSAGVYPEGWDEGPMLDYVLDYYEELKAFYATAAANSQAIIAFVS